MKRVLLVCYKIEKGKGSEDGSGYHIARSIARSRHHLTLITRVNNARLLAGDPDFSSVQIVGVDVPRALGWFKKGGRGIIPYYYLWQICVGARARELHSERPFDVIHQLNFHTDWAPHFLPTPRSRMVWGPISHHKVVPLSFLKERRLAAYGRELSKAAAKQAFWHLDPFLRHQAKRAVVLYADEDRAPPFKGDGVDVRYQSYAASIEAFRIPARRNPRFNVLSVGRFVPLKGFSATVEAFGLFLKDRSSPDATLTLVGSGELDKHLRALADRLGISERVTFVPWVDQEQLATHYQAASVFLYPSFEAQGLVVAEAMAASLPIICLEKTGPSFLAGKAGLQVERRRYGETVAQLADRLHRVFALHAQDRGDGPFMELCRASRREYDERLDWSVIASTILKIYDE